MVEKPSEVTVPESRSSGGTAATQPDTSSAQLGDLSVFNFTSSSQDSGSSCSQRCKNENRNRKKGLTKKNAANREMSVHGATRTTRKQTNETMKKNRLEAINQRWGITDKVNSMKEKEQPCAERARRSSKRVSFQSPAVTSDEPQPEVPQGSTNDLSPGRNTMSQNISEDNTVLNDQTQPGQSMSDNVMQHNKLSTHGPSSNDEHDKVSPLKHSSKRCKVEEVTTLETTPKRPRASPGRKRKSQMSPAILNPPSSASPRCDKSIRNSRQERGESPSALATGGQKSPCTPTASVIRPTSGSPAVMKRNYKGETLLHIASIKVEKFINNSPYLFHPIFLLHSANADFKPFSETVVPFCMML